jgi:cation diffusion facilitator family transporter
MAAESRTAVIAAIAGNLAIAVSKFVAAAFSGSAAMLSEGIHSLVDTGNGVLMLYGMARSKKAPNEQHPFGYGHELYFWTLLVGILIFALGGGMSIVTGVRHIIEPAELGSALLNYAVLGFAALFEGISWGFGWRAFRSERRGRGVIETIRASKDPTSFSVLLEDTAALLGLAFAFAGVYLGESLGVDWIDGASSVLIGTLLCAVSMIMVRESKGLLVGEGVAAVVLDDLRRIIGDDGSVESIGDLTTMYLGPDEVLLAVELRFGADLSSLEVRDGVGRLKAAIRSKYPRITRIFFDTAPQSD